LEYTNTHATEIIETNKRAESETIAEMQTGAGKIKKGVRFKMAPLKKLDNFITYDYIQKQKADGSFENIRTGKISSYRDVTYHAKFEVVTDATVPHGYIIPARFSNIAENLRMHGIKVETLTKSTTFTGEIFQIEKFEKAKQAFQGHAMAQADGKFVSATKKFFKGDFKVEMNQPLANLVFYLLEPQSDDGLLTWNFFDDHIERGKNENKAVEYPVFKIIKSK
jgi:hypothetical protein